MIRSETAGSGEPVPQHQFAARDSEARNKPKQEVLTFQQKQVITNDYRESVSSVAHFPMLRQIYFQHFKVSFPRLNEATLLGFNFKPEFFPPLPQPSGELYPILKSIGAYLDHYLKHHPHIYRKVSRWNKEILSMDAQVLFEMYQWINAWAQKDIRRLEQSDLKEIYKRIDYLKEVKVFIQQQVIYPVLTKKGLATEEQAISAHSYYCQDASDFVKSLEATKEAIQIHILPFVQYFCTPNLKAVLHHLESDRDVIRSIVQTCTHTIKNIYHKINKEGSQFGFYLLFKSIETNFKRKGTALILKWPTLEEFLKSCTQIDKQLIGTQSALRKVEHAQSFNRLWGEYLGAVAPNFPEMRSMAREIAKLEIQKNIWDYEIVEAGKQLIKTLKREFPTLLEWHKADNHLDNKPSGYFNLLPAQEYGLEQITMEATFNKLNQYRGLLQLKFFISFYDFQVNVIKLWNFGCVLNNYVQRYLVDLHPASYQKLYPLIEPSLLELPGLITKNLAMLVSSFRKLKNDMEERPLILSNGIQLNAKKLLNFAPEDIAKHIDLFRHDKKRYCVSMVDGPFLAKDRERFSPEDASDVQKVQKYFESLEPSNRKFYQDMAGYWHEAIRVFIEKAQRDCLEAQMAPEILSWRPPSGDAKDLEPNPKTPTLNYPSRTKDCSSATGISTPADLNIKKTGDSPTDLQTEDLDPAPKTSTSNPKLELENSTDDSETGSDSDGQVITHCSINDSASIESAFYPSCTKDCSLETDTPPDLIKKTEDSPTDSRAKNLDPMLKTSTSNAKLDLDNSTDSEADLDFDKEDITDCSDPSISTESTSTTPSRTKHNSTEVNTRTDHMRWTEDSSTNPPQNQKLGLFGKFPVGLNMAEATMSGLGQQSPAQERTKDAMDEALLATLCCPTTSSMC